MFLLFVVVCKFCMLFCCYCVTESCGGGGGRRSMMKMWVLQQQPEKRTSSVLALSSALAQLFSEEDAPKLGWMDMEMEWNEGKMLALVCVLHHHHSRRRTDKKSHSLSSQSSAKSQPEWELCAISSLQHYQMLLLLKYKNVCT